MKIARLCLLASGVLICSCSLLLKQSATQCSSDRECRSRGAAFAASRCDTTRGVCVSDVQEAGSSGDAGGASGCSVNSDCAQRAEPAVCIKGSCANLYTADCGSVIGLSSLPLDGTQLLGVVLPTTDPPGSNPNTADTLYGQAESNAITVAWTQYDAQRASYPALKPTAFLVCDENAKSMSTVFNHFDALGIKVVIGPMKNDSVLSLIPLAEQHKMALIAPLANDPRLETGTPKQAALDGTYLSLRPNQDREFPAFPAAINKALSLLTAAHPTQFATPHIAILAAPTLSPGSVNISNDLQKSFPSATYLDYSGGDEGQVTASLASANANLIVLTTAEDLWYALVYNVAKGWPGSTLPWFFIPGKSDVIARFINVGDLPPNFIGFDVQRPAESQPIYGAFDSAYKSTFNGQDPPLQMEYPFDAALVGTYGLLGAEQKGGVTPGNVKGFLQQLLLPPPTATTSELNLSALDAVFTLTSVDNTNLTGASGTLDVDATRGSPTSNFEMFCYPPGALNYCDLGLVVDAGSGQISGSQTACKCP